MPGKKEDDNGHDQYRVHGTVTDAGGEEVAGAEVIVWQQQLRTRRQLGTARTSEEGTYRVSFRGPDDFPGKLLIVVQARSDRLEAPLESAITEAAPDLQIDLVAGATDRSEYTTLRRAIDPVLENLTLLDVVENDEHHDLSFLAQETGYGGVSESRVSRAFSGRDGLCSDVTARCRADRRKGRESLEQLSRPAATAQVAVVSRAGRTCFEAGCRQ